MRKYIILAPGQTVSGGPELAHQLCHELSVQGHDAYMYYVFETSSLPSDIEAEPKFLKYQTKHIKSFDDADQGENVVIIPEGLAGFASVFHKATICLWWMSVDNFFEYESVSFDKIAEITSLHLVQSQYAKNFLIENNIPVDRILSLSDYIGDLYKQFIFPAFGRKDIILFNPKKGLENLRPLMEKSTWANWVPLLNLTEEEMVLLMQGAKIYIDFGNHPGKDRIPREAASCGCIVITNQKGSAAFYEDVTIPAKYKFDEPYDYDRVDKFLHECCDNYAEYFNDFNEYRTIIKNDKDTFISETRNFLNYFQEKILE